MKYQIIVLTVAVFCVSVYSEVDIPSYIKLCQFSKPDFDQCALENANYAIPHIVKGDRHLGIPPLNPLHLPLIDVTHNDFKLALTDVEVHGLENTKVKSLSLDKDNFNGVFHIENLNIIGKYVMDGKVLFLALKGEGPSNITAVGGDYTVKASLEPYTKNGVAYRKFTKPHVEFTLQRAYFNFENLLDGEKLGSEINNILNDSWQDVLNDLGSPVKETISTIIESIVSKIISRVPEKDVFGE